MMFLLVAVSVGAHPGHPRAGRPARARSGIQSACHGALIAQAPAPGGRRGPLPPASPQPLPGCGARAMQEFGAFLSIQTETEMVVDRSASNDLLKITFNMR